MAIGQQFDLLVTKFNLLRESISRREWLGVACLGLTIFCALVLTFLVFSSAFDKNTEVWGKAFVFVIGVLAAAATFIFSRKEITQGSGLRVLITPRWIALLVLAIYTAFGAMTDALSLFAPRPAVESAPGVIEETTEDSNQRLRELVPDPTRIERRLPGRWGELQPACGLIWRFAIEDDAFIAEIVRRPEGIEPFRLVARITESEGDVMHLVAREPPEASGSAGTITYENVGGSERVIWEDHMRDSEELELRRCS